MKSAIVFSLIGLGLLLLLASGVWTTLFPGTSTWTDEKDQRMSTIGARLHVLRISVGNAEMNPKTHGGESYAKDKAELTALEEESKALKDEFNSIQSRPQIISKFMKWSGISLAILGMIGCYAVNQSK